jgi:hypothetical protein
MRLFLAGGTPRPVNASAFFRGNTQSRFFAILNRWMVTLCSPLRPNRGVILGVSRPFPARLTIAFCRSGRESSHVSALANPKRSRPPDMQWYHGGRAWR